MSLIKSRKRVADHGEVFTPKWLVDALYEKYGITKEEITFIESMIRPMGEGDE